MNPFKIGDVVTVCEDLNRTSDRFGITKWMLELARHNDEMVVEYVDNYSIKANGWRWHFKDLKHAKPFTLENE